MNNGESYLLHKAARVGDMVYLRQALATQPIQEFFTLCPTDGGYLNIIHVAILCLQQEFIRELLNKLPASAIHFLISQQDTSESKVNALHYVASRGDVDILKLFLDFYRSSPSSSSTVEVSTEKPWLAVDSQGSTPLLRAITQGKEECALEIMSMDMEVLCNMVNDRGTSPLVEAVRRRCPKVAVKILTSGHVYSTSGDDGLTPLDLAPNCTEEVCRLLLDKHPEMLKKVDGNGVTMLHVWVMVGHVWPFHLLIERATTSAWRKDYIDLLCAVENDRNYNPLHVAATGSNEKSVDIVQLLVEAYKKAYELERGDLVRVSPWIRESVLGETPLTRALVSRQQELALYFLSLDSESLVLYASRSTLYCAVSYGCDRVVEKILTSIDPSSFRRKTELVKQEDDHGQNVLHVASNCKERAANMLLDKLPWLINEPDNNGKRPLDTASEVGTAWLIEMLLKKDPSSITSAPHAWTYACKNGHLAAIDAFINHCADFRKLCLGLRDTPLHHIKFRAYKEYKDFIAIPLIEEMKNIVDIDGATPLHRAIECKDIIFTEVLLTTDGVHRSIKDKNGKTAIALLVEICDQDADWDEMCKRIGVNPRLRTTYIQPMNLNLGRATNQSSASSPGEMRSTLSVVAALLATLTFAAGFTLPGGFNSDTGNAILSHKAPFIVFILADTYAMCCAMLVLFCLMWSMVCDSDKSVVLIDRSVLILMQSLYGTLVAFMTGVYTVIAYKSFWVAILVFVMCSLVAISANKTILYKLLDKLIPSADRKIVNQSRSLEEGTPLTTYNYQNEDPTING
ncbi:protein ACCELERATED CELL DEATH 6-like [Silene latifolia]|uniref:protein ACCELERATED CELL DEATH 6-like n=1 Tax=Silene latifolia TaxID=37657 RepID=UPI003D77948D